MKQEFKWILHLELQVPTNDKDRCYDYAKSAMEAAQNRFFDSLNSDDDIGFWKILDEELK